MGEQKYNDMTTSTSFTPKKLLQFTSLLQLWKKHEMRCYWNVLKCPAILIATIWTYSSTM